MHSHSVVAFAFVLSVTAPFARAQCVNDWLPGDPFPGVAGEVSASVMHDPDGSGPLAPRLVVGGDIHLAGAVVTRGIASFDPATRHWSAIGGGLNDHVRALAVLPTNDLFAAGSFDLAGYWSAPVARWNGSLWAPVVGVHQLQGTANAMVMMPNGDLVVGGDMNLFDGVNWTGANVVLWNGTDWVSMQTPNFATVDVLAVLPNGHLLAAGQFLNWPNGGIARWDGSTWSSFATPIDFVSALTVLANGDVVCCGDLGGAVLGVHRSNGGAWTTLGFVGEVRTIREESNGDLLVGGTLSLPGFASPALARWNGSFWQAVGASSGRVLTTTRSPSGGLYAGGAWIETGGGSTANLSELVGTTWTRIGTGTDGDVTVALELRNGDLVVAGEFEEIGGVRANGLARWNGSTWSPLGPGVDGVVLDMAEMPNGDLVVCGQFTSVGGSSVANIARWDGVSWSSLGWSDPLPIAGAPPKAIRTLAVMPNGDLMIGGDFAAFPSLPGPRYIARFDGVTWHSVGAGPSLFVRDMVVLPDGDLVVCGLFTTVEAGVSAPFVARWDGAHWSPMGVGMNNVVNHVFLDARGDLVAAGLFTLAGGNVANGIARWDGASWSGMGAVPGAPAMPMVAALPDGDLVRANVTQGQLERWDGVTWTPMAAVTNPECLVMVRNGELFVGGTQQVNGALSMGYARFATNCPATSVSFGGCPSSGGANVLTAETLPYSDGVLRSLATGTSTTAVAIVATGFGSLPSPIALSTFLPNAGVGCTLAVAPDLLQLQNTTNGIVRSSLAIPASPPVVGLAFFQQMLVLGTDPVFGVVESTSTNALQLTVGSF